jgi:hypothetical protein
MELDLESKGFCIFGLPDSGKSTLVNFILTRWGENAFIYDTLHEYPDQPFDSYCPDDRYSVAELEPVIRQAMARRYGLVVIDEANRFCPSKPAPLPQAVADLNDWRAHYGMAAGFVCRRPVQLNQDLTELAHYLFVFRLDGLNDTRYLNDLCAGLGDAITRLEPYHFIMYHKGQGFQLMAPVPAEFKTDKKL